MRTANPALSENAFRNLSPYHGAKMTIDGTVNKTGILIILAILVAAYSWQLTGTASTIALYGGMIVGLILAIITIFKKEWAYITAPMYAVAEGVFLGAISSLFESMFPGIAIQAIGLTFGTLAVLLIIYRSGLIKVTEKFRMGVFAATGAIMLIYLASFVMSFFGASIPMIHSNGTFGIIFSLVVVGIAALNLVLDFDFIERGAKARAPKYMEWYAAFGLLVTLIWLYIEILRLLSKLRSR